MTNEAPPKTEPTVSVSFIDNPMAPDVLADEAVGFFVHSGIVRITFTSARVNHATSPGPINRVVIGRLAMSIEGAQSLAVGLFDFLKSRGIAPALANQSGEPLKPN
jgi:hypothetical protein